ncbi:MAG: DUF933 domain-containing protein [Candidatus Shikimatogenerans sp. Tcar]|uniref:DUF933 domain-containing protein n=1 Tax=Candidatus Shikimatogenerans sp. Tcar TaxID=3158565 RepID=A0AAU7QSC4_9FLAO
MLKIGIVGLPNVGKSLLFNKLTKNNILSKNYFFSTIKENINFLKIYNKELILLKKIINPKKINYKSIKIIDFAGLIKNASKGKGLGINILNKIQKLDLIIHVIKIFNKKNILNYYNNNVYNNINIIKHELILKDIIYLEKKNNNKYIKYLNILNKYTYLNKFYNKNKKKLNGLITNIPMIYLFNINKNKKNNIKKILLKIKYDIDTPNIGIFFLDIKYNNNRYYKFINYIYKFLNLKYCFTIKNKIITLWLIKNNINVYNFSKKIHTYIYNNYFNSQIIKFKDFIIYKNYNILKKKKLIYFKNKKYLISNKDIIFINYKKN